MASSSRSGGTRPTRDVDGRSNYVTIAAARGFEQQVPPHARRAADAAAAVGGDEEEVMPGSPLPPRREAPTPAQGLLAEFIDGMAQDGRLTLPQTKLLSHLCAEREPRIIAAYDAYLDACEAAVESTAGPLDQQARYQLARKTLEAALATIVRERVAGARDARARHAAIPAATSGTPLSTASAHNDNSSAAAGASRAQRQPQTEAQAPVSEAAMQRLLLRTAQLLYEQGIVSFDVAAAMLQAVTAGDSRMYRAFVAYEAGRLSFTQLVTAMMDAAIDYLDLEDDEAAQQDDDEQEGRGADRAARGQQGAADGDGDGDGEREREEDDDEEVEAGDEDDRQRYTAGVSYANSSEGAVASNGQHGEPISGGDSQGADSATQLAAAASAHADLLASLRADGVISGADATLLRRLFAAADPIVRAAWAVYAVDGNQGELEDTLLRVLDREHEAEWRSRTHTVHVLRGLRDLGLLSDEDAAALEAYVRSTRLPNDPSDAEANFVAAALDEFSRDRDTDGLVLALRTFSSRVRALLAEHAQNAQELATGLVEDDDDRDGPHATALHGQVRARMLAEPLRARSAPAATEDDYEDFSDADAGVGAEEARVKESSDERGATAAPTRQQLKHISALLGHGFTTAAGAASLTRLAHSGDVRMLGAQRAYELNGDLDDYFDTLLRIAAQEETASRGRH